MDTSNLQQIQLLEYLKIISRRRWVVIIFGLIVSTTTLITTLRQQKEYTATVVVHIDMTPPRVVDWDESSNANPRMFDYQAFYNTQYGIINSRTIKGLSVLRLKAAGYTDWDDAADPLAAFGEHLLVSPVKDTRLVHIGYTHHDPAKAAEIANIVADVYIKENLDRKLRTTREADRWLSQQAQSWLEKKTESDKVLLSYLRENDLLAMAEKGALVQKNLADIYNRYNLAIGDRMAAENEYRLLSDYLARKDMDALISYFATPTINSLKEQFNTVDREYQAQSERYLPKHPRMIQLSTERSTLEAMLRDEITRQVKGKEAVYLLNKKQEESLQTEFERAKALAADVEEKLGASQQLRNESERNERFYKQLDKRQAETDLVSLLRNSNIEVIDKAEAPTFPVRPNLPLNLMLALTVSLTGGISLAFGVEYMDKTFKSPDEVEQYLGLPLLGLVPSVKSEDEKANRDTYVYQNPRSTIAECCRSIRTKLILSRADRPLRSLMVTSASPREGKSTVVVSMGITMAMANQRTLLIDTDLRKPRLHQVFRAGLDRGLTSIMDNSSSYEESIIQTDIPNLHLLPAGPIPQNPSELLGSPRMLEVLRELENRYDMIIFDSPPCIAVTDAVVLASRLDGVIFVIKQGSTTKDAAREAVRRMADVQDKLLGCVMNDVDIERDAYGYRYYYYYYYHYYGDDNA